MFDGGIVGFLVDEHEDDIEARPFCGVREFDVVVGVSSQMMDFLAVDGETRVDGLVGLARLDLDKDNGALVGSLGDDVKVALAAPVVPVAFQDDVALLF